MEEWEVEAEALGRHPFRDPGAVTALRPLGLYEGADCLRSRDKATDHVQVCQKLRKTSFLFAHVYTEFYLLFLLVRLFELVLVYVGSISTGIQRQKF